MNRSGPLNEEVLILPLLHPNFMFIRKRIRPSTSSSKAAGDSVTWNRECLRPRSAPRL